MSSRFTFLVSLLIISLVLLIYRYQDAIDDLVEGIGSLDEILEEQVYEITFGSREPDIPYVEPRIPVIRYGTYSLSLFEKRQLAQLVRDRQFEQAESVIASYMGEFERDVRFENKLSNAFDVFESEANILTQVDEWIERYPESYAARLAKAQILYDKGWEARGNKYSSKTPDENFQKMREYFYLAREEFSDALALKKNLPSAYCSLIKMAAANGQRKEKLRVLKRGLEHIPYSYGVRYCYLNKLQPKWGGSWEEMAQYAEIAQGHLQENPQLQGLYAEFYFSWAISYRHKKEYEQAIKYFSRALEYARGAGTLHYRGRSYAALGEYGLALKDLNESLDLYPDTYYPLSYRAYIFRKLKKYDHALKDVSRLIELYPDNLKVYTTRANIYWDMGEYQKSYDDYSYVIEREPEDVYALKNRGRLNTYHLKDYDQAILDLNQAKLIDPDAGVLYEYASALYHAKRPGSLEAYEAYILVCKVEECDQSSLDWAREFQQCMRSTCDTDPKYYQPWKELRNKEVNLRLDGKGITTEQDRG